MSNDRTVGRSASPVLQFSTLVGYLSPAVGDEVANNVLVDAANALGIPATGLVRQKDALQMLEHLAGTPGLVGVTARFAKSRVLLAPSKRN